MERPTWQAKITPALNTRRRSSPLTFVAWVYISHSFQTNSQSHEHVFRNPLTCPVLKSNPLTHQVLESNPITHLILDSNPFTHLILAINPLTHPILDSKPLMHSVLVSNPSLTWSWRATTHLGQQPSHSFSLGKQPLNHGQQPPHSWTATPSPARPRPTALSVN